MPSRAEIARPLNDILPQRVKNKNTEFDDTQVKAFKTHMSALANAAMLTNPCPHAELSLVTDASDFAIGGVRQQQIDSILAPLPFFQESCNQRKNDTMHLDENCLRFTYHFVT